MNSSSGLGRPSGDQPDFDGPAGGLYRPGAGQPGQPGPGWPGGPPDAPAGGQPTPGWSAIGQPGGQPDGTTPAPWTPPGQQQPMYRQESYQPGPYQPAPYQQGSVQPDSFQQTGQPGHGPSGQPWAPPTQPPYGAGNQPAWAPPGGSPQTSGRPPRRSFNRGLLVAGALIVAAVLALVGWQFLAPRTVPQAGSTPSAAASTDPPASPAGSASPTVVRSSPATRPTTSTPVSGGQLGQAVDFTTQGGAGRVTVTQATWADNGDIRPADGTAYLVLDVTFEGVSGTVTTGPFFTWVTDGSGDQHVMTIGARLDRQLAMRTLTAGQQNTGQVAFELARGPVTFGVLSEVLQEVATVDVPG